MSLIEAAPMAPAIETRVAASISPRQRGEYSVPIGYLRAFVTLLVLAHHSVLAYVPFGAPVPANLVARPRLWQAFPVLDPAKWGGFGLFTGFNDVYFMALMFFISGLFVWNSIERKGPRGFVRGRMLRLGLPFLVAAAVLAPIAYYPAYLQTGARGFAGFWRQWLALGSWPAGPAWFVWVLLAFDCAAAAIFLAAPRSALNLGERLSRIARRPSLFFAILAAVSAAAYLPMALLFDPFRWTEFGPFVFQTSRIFHYLAYFLFGLALGACGISRGLFATDGKLARRWVWWVNVAPFLLAALTVAFLVAISTPAHPVRWAVIGGILFALACAVSCLACLAVFLRFARRTRPLFDSLRDNAYGMYLIHYAFANWLQFALLGAPLPAIAKGLLAIIGTVLLSWGVTAALRRIPAVARVI